MRLILLILVFLTISSCFVSKSRRVERKINKIKKIDPLYFQLDTIKLVDTLIIEKEYHDTISQLISQDTVTVINNEKVLLKYFYDTTRVEIWHEIEVKPDTVIIQEEVVVEKLIHPKRGISTNWLIIGALLFVGFSFFLFRNNNFRQ